jgi:predicted transglutaminase-like protease
MITIPGKNYAADETLPIINKPKYPKKKGGAEYKEQNERTHIQEDKRITEEGKPQGEHEADQLH